MGVIIFVEAQLASQRKKKRKGFCFFGGGTELSCAFCDMINTEKETFPSTLLGGTKSVQD